MDGLVLRRQCVNVCKHTRFHPSHDYGEGEIKWAATKTSEQFRLNIDNFLEWLLRNAMPEI